MKKLIYLLSSLIMVFFFVSCDIENDTDIYPLYGYYWQPYTTNSNGQYVIGGYVNGQTKSSPKTKAAIAGGTYTDFALYSWTADSVVMDGYHGIFQGNTWGYTEAVKYFDNDEDEYSFIGIIPQNATQTLNATTHTVTVEDLPSFVTNDAGAQVGTQLGSYAEDREFLYAATSVLNADFGTGATLTFNHGNVKIYLKFTSDNTNTQIVDFTPYTPGTPGQAAYDETVDVTTYQMTATTVPTLGPLATAITISDADMDYVNAKFTASKGFGSYQTSNVITGDLTEDMWAYLVSKYPALSTINTGNWATYTANSNMRLVHIDKNGHSSADNDSYRAVFVNVQSINWSAGTTTQQIIHHDAVPAVPATGHEGIVVLPATSVTGNGIDAVLATYPATVDANVSLTDVTYTQKTTANEVTYSLPTTQSFGTSSTQVASPTTWYTFPASANSTSNVGYTIKFSYTYDGVLTKYDNRVFLPASECQWEEGKYYTYVINIRGKGNGKIDPASADEDDPKVPQTNEITVTSVIVDYQTGQTHEHTIK